MQVTSFRWITNLVWILSHPETPTQKLQGLLLIIKLKLKLKLNAYSYSYNLCISKKYSYGIKCCFLIFYFYLEIISGPWNNISFTHTGTDIALFGSITHSNVGNTSIITLQSVCSGHPGQVRSEGLVFSRWMLSRHCITWLNGCLCIMFRPKLWADGVTLCVLCIRSLWAPPLKKFVFLQILSMNFVSYDFLS